MDLGQQVGIPARRTMPELFKSYYLGVHLCTTKSKVDLVSARSQWPILAASLDEMHDL